MACAMATGLGGTLMENKGAPGKRAGPAVSPSEHEVSPACPSLRGPSFNLLIEPSPPLQPTLVHPRSVGNRMAEIGIHPTLGL
jgi:hypothetical protein